MIRNRLHEGRRLLSRSAGSDLVNPEIIRAARDMVPQPAASVASIANLPGISPGTLYNHIPDLQELRAAGRKAQLTAPAN